MKIGYAPSTFMFGRLKRSVMKRTTIAIVLILLSFGPAAAEPDQRPGAMPVSVFMAKAEALRAQGAMALFSSDIGVLKAEVSGSAQAFRQQVKVEAANGRQSACPPERAALTSDDLIAQMLTVPFPLIESDVERFTRN
jgi:hypothetical protein